ncbi:MAG TPA: spore germination protein GerW family protein [Ktedonobacteraceae bacterium]|nr:spore germination protein GerW family protein [Ktedonobacteraceae bacterium]
MITDENVKAPLADPTEQALSKLAITASADAIFGEPVVNGDTTVIPCSEVVIGMGMGSGGGPADENGKPTGSGSGGGGGARSRPVAAIIITQDGVRVEPILDLTKIVLASLTTGAFILLWIGRLSLMRRSGRMPSLSKIRRSIGS